MDVKCVLSQKAFDAFCEKFHIPEEVHPVLPNRGDTIHERPAGKIVLYTRFFNFANFRLPLSTFLVDILSKRSDNVPVYYTKPFDSLKNWNDHFFWVIVHTAKKATRDPALVAAEFNLQDYATLVAHPSPFQKFPEEFLCLVGLSRHYILDEETYPRFMHKNGEGGDGSLCFHSYSGSYLIAPDRVDSELETSIDRLFYEGGSGSQAGKGGSTGVEEGTNVQPVIEATSIVTEDVAPLQPRRQMKRKTVVAYAGGSLHPPKKLWEDHGTSSGPSVVGKSRSVVQRLLVGAVLNVEVRDEPIPTLPFVTSSVSATLEHEGGDHIDSAEVDSLVKSFVLVMTNFTITTSTADPVVVVKKKIVKPSLFVVDSSSAGGVDHNAVNIPRWSVTNGSRLDDGRVCREMVDEFALPTFFASVRGMKHNQLFTEFNVRAAHQMSLSAVVRMRAEYNIKEKRRLKFAIEEKDELLKARDREIENIKSHIVLKKAEATEAIRLCDEASNFVAVEKSLRDEVNIVNELNTILEKERDALDVKVADLEASTVIKEREMTNLSAQLTFVKSHNDILVDQVSSSRLQEKLSNYENLTERLKEFQDAQLKVMNAKFDKLYVDFVEMALHLDERFYHHLLTTISGRRWLLTHGMKLAITKCLHSPKYISALGAAIGKAIEKGMQDRLSAGITHGMEETLAERLGLTESQPHVDQLMVHIHHLPDQVVVGASALLLALNVSSSRVWKINENIANHSLALRDVFVLLAEPLSATALTDTKGTSNIISATANTTMALSTTSASTIIVAPISVDDYEVTGTDDQAGANGNANPFPNVDDAKLNIPFTFITSYGPSHLRPSFPVSSARLASLLRYTSFTYCCFFSPFFQEIEFDFQTSLFCTKSTFVVLSVGMPISARITASVLYVNENGVSLLLDFIIVRESESADDMVKVALLGAKGKMDGCDDDWMLLTKVTQQAHIC
uniref:Transposase (Putative), gypsy type n=1 Tax=Tanacetum cinerariifolium TaxID=118510 RepID=A0A6L2MK13_TANCI|nr:hypothetical protein [Tanacetum cinerariifolium]